MAGDEDQRTAIGLKIGLSSTLMAVSLAFIGAAAGIATFVLDKREHLFWFYVCFVGSLVLLTISGVLGGKGISVAYKSGFSGQWVCEDKGIFNGQAVSLLLGIVLVCLTAFTGVPKPSTDLSEAAKFDSLEKKIDSLQQQLTDLQAQASPVHFAKTPTRPSASGIQKRAKKAAHSGQPRR